MVYTEIREINGKKYYYRVQSIRNGKKVSKKRIYLGYNLLSDILSKKEVDADKNLLLESKKIIDKKANKNIRIIKTKIISILKENNVSEAGIFGSYSRGEQKENSDIDILVRINDKNMSLLGFIGLKLKLEEKLKKKVDLVEYSSIKPLIKKRILNEEIKIL